MTRRRVLTIGAIGAAIALALVVALIVKKTHRSAEIPPNLIPSSWNEVRNSPGHAQHVEKRGIACTECHDYERDGFKNPGSAPCAQCHKKESSHSHAGDVAMKTDCTTCHAFASAEQK